MKRPKWTGRCRGRWLALAIAPALAWVGVLWLAPTDWARARLADRLGRATGRPVTIGAVRLGALGDLRLVDLAIGGPRSGGDPWLKAAEVRIDVQLGQVLLGHCEPREVVVDGLDLRLRVRADGSAEFDELARPTRSAQAGTTRDRAAEGPEIAWKVRGATVQVVDEPSGTRVDLSEVDAEGTVGPRSIGLDKLAGKFNGGTVAMAARFDREGASPRFRVEARARGVELDRGLRALTTFVPVVAGGEVMGKLGLRVDVEGWGANRAEISRTLKGNGEIALDPVDLHDSRFLLELEALGDWPSGGRIGSVTSNFLVDHGRFSTDDLTIRVSQLPFVMGGWADFDGRFEYAAKVDAVAARLPRAAGRWSKEIQSGLDQLAGLRIKGDRDRVDVTLQGRPLLGDPGQADGDRLKARETARRIRDRFFR